MGEKKASWNHYFPSVLGRDTQKWLISAVPFVFCLYQTKGSKNGTKILDPQIGPFLSCLWGLRPFLGTKMWAADRSICMCIYIYIQGVASIEPKKIELIASSAGRMPFLKKWHSPCNFFHKMHFFSRSRMPYSKRNYKTRHFWREYKTQICHLLRKLFHNTIKIGICVTNFMTFFSRDRMAL